LLYALAGLVVSYLATFCFDCFCLSLLSQESFTFNSSMVSCCVLLF
jgi:hypothetical protein